MDELPKGSTWRQADDFLRRKGFKTDANPLTHYVAGNRYNNYCFFSGDVIRARVVLDDNYRVSHVEVTQDSEGL